MGRLTSGALWFSVVGAAGILAEHAGLGLSAQVTRSPLLATLP